MRVMLSWSGGRSKHVAQSLAHFIDQVLRVRTWVSSRDLRPGVLWSQAVLRALQDARVGIVCLTPENLLAPWIHFEAGVLLSTTQQMRHAGARRNSPQAVVCTYLFDAQPEALQDPLRMFQATLAEEADTRKLIEAINGLLPPSKRVAPKDLEESFSAFWPKLATALHRIRTQPAERGSDPAIQTIRESKVEMRKRLAASAGGR